MYSARKHDMLVGFNLNCPTILSCNSFINLNQNLVGLYVGGWNRAVFNPYNPQTFSSVKILKQKC